MSSSLPPPIGVGGGSGGLGLGGGDDAEDPTPASNSFAAHRSLRVAVVPLGGTPPARFQQYLGLLRRFPELPMASLSKPGSWRKEASPWRHFSWFEGSLLLRYEDGGAGSGASGGGSSGGGDLGALARQGQEWQGFQAHRRTWAVLGIVHIPSCTAASLKGVQAEFQARCKEFPYAVAAKVFCFGHSFEAEQQASAPVGAGGGLLALEAGFKQHKDQLVVFPPEGDDRVADGGMSMVELHTGAMLHDVAVSVLLQLEEEVKRTRATSNSKKTTAAKRGGQWLSGLRSPFDDESSKGGSAGSGGAGGVGSNTANQGRINKWVGDLSLLAGSPQDAIEAYATAIGECKTVADTLWQAGALEGWVAALDTMVQMHLPLEEYVSAAAASASGASTVAVGRDLLSKGEAGSAAAAKALLKEVEEKVTEALTLLEPQAPYAPLAVELSFKMARYHGQARPFPSTGGSPRHTEALAYVMRAMAVSPIAPPLQILRSLEAAALCRWLGLQRKFALFLRLAAVQASELGSHSAAHALALVAADAYGVRALNDDDDHDAHPSATGSTPAPSPVRPPQRDPRASVFPPPPGGWPCLQRHLLGDLVAYATAARDVPAACAHYLALLHLCADLEVGRQRALLLTGGGGGLPPALLLPPTPTTTTGSTTATVGLALSPSSIAQSGSGWPSSAGEQQQAPQAPLTASGEAPKLLAVESAEQRRRLSGGYEDGIAGEEGEGEEDEEEEIVDDDYDDFSDDEGAPSDGGGPGSRPASHGRPLSGERWQLRGGLALGRRFNSAGGVVAGASGTNLLLQAAASSGSASSLGGFGALKLGVKRGKRVLRPFTRSGGGGGGGVEGGGAGEDRVSSGGSSLAATGAAAVAEGISPSCWTSLVAPNVAASPEEQEALIADMMRLTRRLPPRTPLASQRLPHVHFVRPLRLAPDLVPLPLKAAAGGAPLSPQPEQEAQQAFIYNPFADKGAKGAKRAVTWAAGEVALVALAMANPLAAPVNVQSIELLVEEEEAAAAAAEGGGAEGEEGGGGGGDGPVAFCYPLTLWVPPYSRAHPLTLALKPLRPGKLVIRGVKMTVFNITSTVFVDAEGAGPTPPVCAAPRDWYPRQAQAYSRTPAKGDRGKKKGGSGAGGKEGVDSKGEDGQAHYGRQASNGGAGGGASGGGGFFQSLEEAVVPTTRVSVVAPLPRLTTRLDRWATNVELLPGEYRRAQLEVEVANEVPIGYLEVCVHQKARQRRQHHRAAGRPVPLYVFAATADAADGQRPGDGEAHCPQAPEGDLHHPLHPQQQEHMAVALDPTGLQSLTAALRSALRAGSCLSRLHLPLLLRRVDRFPAADVLVRYSAGPGHKHQRTLTVPLRFHLKDGLAAKDVAVETAEVGVYPALVRVVEASHRGTWEGTETPVVVRDHPSGKGMKQKGQLGGWTGEVVDTDHGECLLLAEVANAAGEDLHVKTCLLEEEGAGGGVAALSPQEAAEAETSSSPHHALASELALLQDLTSDAPTAMVVRPQASRRLVIPFPRLDPSSPLLQPPPPPAPPPGGGQAPKPLVTHDSPEWTRALHGLCRSLRVQWADRHGLRSGLLRLPLTLASTVRPAALQRLRLPMLKLSCAVGEEGQGQGGEEARPLLRRRASTTTATYTVLPPMAVQQDGEQEEGGGGGGGDEGPWQEQSPQEQEQEQEQGATARRRSSAPADSSKKAVRTFAPYAFVPVHFRVTNRSQTRLLPPAKCFCHTFQDYGNGNLNFAIDGVRAVWSGSLAWTTPALAPGESHLHVAYVSFTAGGSYGVALSASFLPPDSPPSQQQQQPEGGGRGAGGERRAQRLGSRSGFVGDGGAGGAGKGPLVYLGHETLRLLITEVPRGD